VAVVGYAWLLLDSRHATKCVERWIQRPSGSLEMAHQYLCEIDATTPSTTPSSPPSSVDIEDMRMSVPFEDLLAKASPTNRGRWADISNSDDEDGLPVSAHWVLGDAASKVGLHVRSEIATTVGLIGGDGSTRTPFSCLSLIGGDGSTRSTASSPRGSSRSDSIAGMTVSTPCNGSEAEAPSVPPLALNPRAQEFIPTTTSLCPVVAVCCFVPQDRYSQMQRGTLPPLAEGELVLGSLTMGGLASVAAVNAGIAAEDAVAFGVTSMARSLLHDLDAASSACDQESQVSSLPAEEWPALGTSVASDSVDEQSRSQRRRRKVRASRPSPLCTQALDAGIDLRECRGLQPALEDPSDGCHILSNAAAETEVVTEDQWEHRAATRQRAIDIGKATKEYSWHSDRQHKDDEPLTPDPTDRSISKRQWKYRVMQWRTAFNQRYLESQSRAIYMEECGSVDTAATSTTASLRCEGTDADPSSL